MPDGSCEALPPSDGRLTPEGRLPEGVRDGDDGTRPALGRDAPDEGSWDGRDTEPVDGRETLPVDGRETLPVDGRVAALEIELLPPDGRE